MRITGCLNISGVMFADWELIGVPYRVTAWPEVQFERLYGTDWIPTAPAEEALASAAQALGPLEWRPYLEFVPTEVREFLARFRRWRPDKDPHDCTMAQLDRPEGPDLLGVLREASAGAVE